MGKVSAEAMEVAEDLEVRDSEEAALEVVEDLEVKDSVEDMDVRVTHPNRFHCFRIKKLILTNLK